MTLLDGGGMHVTMTRPRDDRKVSGFQSGTTISMLSHVVDTICPGVLASGGDGYEGKERFAAMPSATDSNKNALDCMC